MTANPTPPPQWLIDELQHLQATSMVKGAGIYPPNDYALADVADAINARFERAVGYKGEYAILATEEVRKAWYGEGEQG